MHAEQIGAVGAPPLQPHDGEGAAAHSASPSVAAAGPKPERTKRNQGERPTAAPRPSVTKVTRENGVVVATSDFTPNSHHPMFELPFHFLTEPANRVFETTFNAAQKALYHIYTLLPIQFRERPEDANAVLTMVNERFEEIEKSLGDEMARLRHIVNDEGATSASSYYHSQPMLVQVQTPAMTRFLGLIVKMDEVLRLIDALWFSTRIAERERTQRMMQWRNEITRFHRFLTNTYTRSANSRRAQVDEDEGDVQTEGDGVGKRVAKKRPQRKPQAKKKDAPTTEGQPLAAESDVGSEVPA